MSLRLVIGPHHEQPGHLAVRARRGLQRDRIHAGDFDQAFAQRFQNVQRALRNFLRLVGMPVRDSFHPRHRFVHARVVLHRARAQRIHAEIDRIIPGGKPGEVANDFDLAHFGHVAEIFSLRCTEKLRSIDFRHIERRQLPRGLARRRLLEDQAFVLIDVERGLASHVLHRATSSTPSSSLADRADRSLSATSPTAVSIAPRVVSSVQHHNAAFPSSG